VDDKGEPKKIFLRKKNKESGEVVVWRDRLWSEHYTYRSGGKWVGQKKEKKED